MTTSRLFSVLACAGMLAACAADQPDSATPIGPTPLESGAATGASPVDAGAGPAGDPASENIVGTGAATRTPIAQVTELVASGNEPFWSVEVEGGTLVYSTPEQMPGVTLHAEREDRPDGVLFHGRDGDRAFELRITDEACQDSMSGWNFDFTARVAHGDRVLTGCARRASDQVGEPR